MILSRLFIDIGNSINQGTSFNMEQIIKDLMYFNYGINYISQILIHTLVFKIL